MAFATTNIQSGVFGNMKYYAGDWSGSVGDASGTITLNGARVYLPIVYNQDAASTEDRPTPVDITASGSTITVTVHNHSNVTNGRFLFIFS